MNITRYSEFRNFVALGDRAQAAKSVEQFIDSFEDEAERSEWVREFLEGGDYGHKIRHEIYRDLIFPELYIGYQSNDPWSLYFLAHTIQNVFDVRELHERLDRATDYSLLSSCFCIAPDFRDVRVQLLDRVCRGLDFAIHEWPAGLCCDIDDVESELRLARALDSESRLVRMFEEVEAIVAEARERTRNSQDAKNGAAR